MNARSQNLAAPALYEQVAERLRNRIFAHELPPGAWVDEQTLAEEFGISRTPLREALKVLAVESFLADMAQSGADIIDVDWMVDMGQAATIFGERAAVCGNQDPVAVMLNGSPEDVRRITHACMAAGGPRSISAAGCEIPLGTPHANLLAQAAALTELG